jgi:hypothetical protein
LNSFFLKTGFILFVAVIATSCRSGHFAQQTFEQTEPTFRATLLSSALFDSPAAFVKGVSFIVELRTSGGSQEDRLIRNQTFNVEIDHPSLMTKKIQTLDSDGLGHLLIQTNFEENTEDPRAIFEANLKIGSTFYGSQNYILKFQLSKTESPVLSLAENSSSHFSPSVAATPKDFTAEATQAILISQTQLARLNSELSLQISAHLTDTRTNENLKNEKIILSFSSVSSGKKKELSLETDAAGFVRFPLEVEASFYDHERVYEVPVEIKLANSPNIPSKTFILLFNFETNASHPLLGQRLSSPSVSTSKENSIPVSPQSILIEVSRLDRLAGQAEIFIDDRLNLFYQPHDELKLKLSLSRNTLKGPSLRALSKVSLRGKTVLVSETIGSSQILLDQMQDFETNESGELSILLSPKVSDLRIRHRNLHLLIALEIPDYLKSTTNFFDINLATRTVIRLDRAEAKKRLNGVLLNDVSSATTPNISKKKTSTEVFNGMISLKDFLSQGRDLLSREEISLRDELSFNLGKEWSAQDINYWKSMESILLKVLKIKPRATEIPELQATSYDFVDSISKGPDLVKAEARQTIYKTQTNLPLQEDLYEFKMEVNGARCLLVQFKNSADGTASYYFCQDPRTKFNAVERYRNVRSVLNVELENSQTLDSQFEILLRGSKQLSEFKTMEEMMAHDLLAHPDAELAGVIVQTLYPTFIARR